MAAVCASLVCSTCPPAHSTSNRLAYMNRVSVPFSFGCFSLKLQECPLVLSLPATKSDAVTRALLPHHPHARCSSISPFMAEVDSDEEDAHMMVDKTLLLFQVSLEQALECGRC
eukprot:44570-Pelagomonas_calceolata.AAC.1